MADIWFSSDLHFGHANIITFCNRPFQSVDEMNEKLIEWHNEFVRPQDHWWFLGDLTMRRGGKKDEDWLKSIVSRMNGHKRIVLGNHDHLRPRAYIEAGFEKVFGSWRMDGFILSHIPIHPYSMSSARACVHGHIHNNQGNDFKPVIQVYPDGSTKIKPYINLSVEVINYHPVNLEQVNEMIRKEIEAIG